MGNTCATVSEPDAQEGLFLACTEGDLSAVTGCLQRGAVVSRRYQEERADTDGWTALHFASKHGHVNVITALLQAGADINMATPASEALGTPYGGMTPLHLAITGGEAVHAVQTLLQQGAHVNARDEDQSTALHMAAIKNNHRLLAAVLSGPMKAELDAADATGVTALHICAVKGNVSVTKELLSAGASPHIPDNGGRTPLHWAVQCGRFDVAELLLSSSADVNAVSAAGKTPLFSVLENYHQISQSVVVQVVKQLLMWGAHVNHKDAVGDVPLQKAVYLPQIIVNALFERGADEFIANARGHTPRDCFTRSDRRNKVYKRSLLSIYGPPAQCLYMIARRMENFSETPQEVWESGVCGKQEAGFEDCGPMHPLYAGVGHTLILPPEIILHIASYLEKGFRSRFIENRRE